MSSNGSSDPKGIGFDGRMAPAIGTGVVVVLLAVVGLSRVGCVNVMTPAGHEGYVKTKPLFGAAQYDTFQKGPTSTGWVWRREVINVDMRPRTWSEDMSILTAERLELKFRAHALIQLRSGRVRDVVEKYGGDRWYESNVQQQFRSVVRGKVQALNAFDVKSRMTEISDAVQADLTERYQDSPFEIMAVNIGNIEYPDVVTTSVIDKFVTNEDNERKDIELQISQRQIDIGIAEAEGVADAQRIIRTTLDPMFLQYEALEAVEQLADSKNTTFLILPYSKDGAAPIIMNMGD